MAGEFKPGHPVIFWGFIVVLVFVMYSVSVAILTHNDCDAVSGGKKAWVVWPPDWDCGADGKIQLTRD